MRSAAVLHVGSGLPLGRSIRNDEHNHTATRHHQAEVRNGTFGNRRPQSICQHVAFLSSGNPTHPSQVIHSALSAMWSMGRVFLSRRKSRRESFFPPKNIPQKARPMKALSKGAFMRFWKSRQVAFYRRCHRGQGTDYRRFQCVFAFVEAKRGQYEFDFGHGGTL